VKPALTAVLALVIAGCGGEDAQPPLPTRAPSLGPTRAHRPPSLGNAAASGKPIAGLRCTRAARPRFGIHLELFAARRVVLVAPGIGIAPPRTRDGAYVRGGRCSYPLRTREPTGVIEVEGGARTKTLGDLFAVWGQPLSRRRMAGFRGGVSAYVGGRLRPGDPRTIPLTRHAQIVLEVDGYIPPHPRYHFPPGL
jgi:hypothetical protein